MFFQNRDRHPSHFAIARDVVEVIAILAAGAWAFYTFIYENRIKPAADPPEIVFRGEMQTLGSHHGLIAVRTAIDANNIGKTRVQFLAYSVTVTGQRVIAERENDADVVVNGSHEALPFYRLSKPEIVYRFWYRTSATDPALPSDLFLQPGAAGHSEFITYAPVGRYDRMSAVISMVFTKSDRVPIRTSVSYQGGIPVFTPNSLKGEEMYRAMQTIATLDVPSH